MDSFLEFASTPAGAVVCIVAILALVALFGMVFLLDLRNGNKGE